MKVFYSLYSLFVHLSIYLFTYLLIYLFIYSFLFIYLFFFIYLLIYLFIYLDVLSDSSVEEDRLLGHNPHLGADEGHVQCLHTLRLDLEIHMMGVGGVEGNIRSRKWRKMKSSTKLIFNWYEMVERSKALILPEI